MRTLDEALNQFAYHPATPEVSEKYAEMRERVMELTHRTWNLIPDGPEKTLAFRGLQQFLMHANLAIAMTTPADLENAHVARVMPGTWRCVSCGQEKSPHEAKISCCPEHASNGHLCIPCAEGHHPVHSIRDPE